MPVTLASLALEGVCPSELMPAGHPRGGMPSGWICHGRATGVQFGAGQHNRGASVAVGAAVQRL